MLSTEKPAFVAALIRAFRFAGKDIRQDSELIADWLEEFAAYPLAALEEAFRHQRRASPYPPKPHDLYRFLEGTEAQDGRPTGDEAWGLLLHVVNDERATGVLSDEMRDAWAICDAILKAGDEVGARRCFLDAYARLVAQARERHQRPRWNVTLGTDPQQRAGVLQDAVAAQRISADYAQSLLPAPVASMEHLAGLLEHDGPQADPDQPSLAERWRGLAKKLRASQADGQTQAMQDEEKRRKALDAKKAQIACDWDEQTRRAA